MGKDEIMNTLYVSINTIAGNIPVVPSSETSSNTSGFSSGSDSSPKQDSPRRLFNIDCGGGKINLRELVNEVERELDIDLGRDTVVLREIERDPSPPPSNFFQDMHTPPWPFKVADCKNAPDKLEYDPFQPQRPYNSSCPMDAKFLPPLYWSIQSPFGYHTRSESYMPTFRAPPETPMVRQKYLSDSNLAAQQGYKQLELNSPPSSLEAINKVNPYILRLMEYVFDCKRQQRLKQSPYLTKTTSMLLIDWEYKQEPGKQSRSISLDNLVLANYKVPWEKVFKIYPAEDDIAQRQGSVEENKSPRMNHINMIKTDHNIQSFLTMSTTQYILPLSHNTNNVINLPEAKMIFSTIVLDDTAYAPVVIEKERFSKHFPKEHEFYHPVPCFHVVFVVHKNLPSTDLNVLDFPDEIQLSCARSKRFQYSPSTQSMGIIVLLEENYRKEYRPHLTNNKFESIQDLKNCIYLNIPLKRERVPVRCIELTRDFIVPVPTEKGHFFFPNIYQEGDTKLRFYDLQIPFLPIVNKDIYFNINSMVLPFSGTYTVYFKPENRPVTPIICPPQTNTLFYDKLLCQILSTQFIPGALENVVGKTLAFPFAFPVDQNLNETFIHPEKIVISPGKSKIPIFRTTRSPLFFILFQFTSTGTIRQIILHSKAIGIFVLLHDKYFFFNFLTPVSSTLIGGRSQPKMTVDKRERVPYVPPPFLCNIETEIISATRDKPARMIFLGGKEATYLQQEHTTGMQLNVFQPIKNNIIKKLQHDDSNEGSTCMEVVEQQSSQNAIISQGSCNEQELVEFYNAKHEQSLKVTKKKEKLSPIAEHRENLTTPSPDYVQSNCSIQQEHDQHFPVFKDDIPSDGSSNIDVPYFPIWPDDFYDKLPDVKIPVVNEQVDNEVSSLTNKSTTNSFKGKCKTVYHGFMDCLSEMELNLANPPNQGLDMDNKKAKVSSKQDQVGFDQSTDFWNKYLNPPNLKNKHNVSMINQTEGPSNLSTMLPMVSRKEIWEQPMSTIPYLPFHVYDYVRSSSKYKEFPSQTQVFNDPTMTKMENETIREVTGQSISNSDESLDLLIQPSLYNLTPKEANPWAKFPVGLHKNETILNSDPNNFDIHANDFSHKYLFLFESDVERQKENQAKKLLSILHIFTPMSSTFQKITCLVDTGSDVTLISYDKLKTMAPQTYIDKNLKKENVVLKSFSNDGIKIIGVIDLKIKFNAKDEEKPWKFLIVDQDCAIQCIIGNDLIMAYNISIIMNKYTGPKLVSPSGIEIETYNARINAISNIPCFLELNPLEYKVIKVNPHPALNIMEKEKILVEGIGNSNEYVIPLVSGLPMDKKIPIAVKNPSNTKIQIDIEIKVTLLSSNNRVVSRNDIDIDQIFSLQTPIQFTNQYSPFHLGNIEKTKERNMYRVEVQCKDNVSKIKHLNKEKVKCFKSGPDLLNACSLDQANKDQSVQKENTDDLDNDILGESPTDFMKDLDSKLLPDGYELPQQKSKICDIIKLEEYPPCLRPRIKDIFIDKFSNIVSKHDYEIASLSNTMGPIKIFLKPNAYLPPIDKVYYLQQEQGQHLRDILDYLLKEEIIERCSPNANTGFNNFSSPAYLVGKANPHKSAYRLIINYKDLNEEILTQFPVLPNISQYVQTLSKAYVFSQFDLSSAFYSLSLDKESRKLTMFTTCQGNFLFKRLPMGLAQSPSSFSVVANNLIHTKPAKDSKGQIIYDSPNLVRLEPDFEENVLIYFDDVLIFSEFREDYIQTMEHHFDIVERIMSKLSYHDARIKWSKVQIAKTSILFLGHKISRGVLYADPRRVEKLLSAKFPENSVTGMKSFLGLINCLRTFFPQNIMKNIVKLQELTSGKYKPLQEHYEAFENLKKDLTQEPLYTNIISPNARYLLFCDAATGKHAQFSGVLTQIVDSSDYIPSHINLCDPIQYYIHKEKLPYQAIPRYLGNEFVCKTKVDTNIYNPVLFNSYYENPLIGYTKDQVINSIFIAIQSIYYELKCRPLNIDEIRKEVALNCKKTLIFHKLKTYAFGGHHLKTKEFLGNFEKGCENVDSFLFMVHQIAKVIHRSIILLIYDEDLTAVEKQIFNPNNKVPLVLGLYKIQGELLFSPFKSTFYQPMDPEEFRNKIQIVSYYAKSIPSATSNLDIMQLEALGMIYCLTYFKQFINLSRLTIVTDNLVFFSIFSRRILDHSTIMSRYSLKLLTQFPGVKIRHILTKNNLADFFTRENKVTRRTYARLPLKAFSTDEKLKDVINQKEDLTLMEFADFVQKNQSYILLDQNAELKGKEKQAEGIQAKAILLTCKNVHIIHQDHEFKPKIPMIDFLYENKPIFIFDTSPVKSELSSQEEKCLSMDLNSFAITRSKAKTLDTIKPPLSDNNSEPPKEINADVSKVLVPEDKKQNSNKATNLQDSITKNTRGSSKMHQTRSQTKILSENENGQDIRDTATQSKNYPPSLSDPDVNTKLTGDSGKGDKDDQNETGVSRYKMQNYWFISNQLEELCSYENLLEEQKKSYKDIIDQCKISEGFKMYKGEKCYKLENGILKLETKAGETKIMLPSHQVGTIIALFHLITFHKGANAIFNTMDLYYHSNLFQLIKLYIGSCYRCLLVNKKKQEQLGHIPAIRVGYTFHIDLMENLNPQKSYRHILVCVDAFSKLMLTYPVISKTTRQTLPYILYGLYQIFNIRYLISDNGPAFSSKNFKKTVNELGVKHITISPNNPRSNGQAEKYVGLLKDMLRKALSTSDTENWLELLPIITKAHNTTKLSKLNLSPLELVHGHNNPNSITALTNPNINVDTPPYLSSTESQSIMAKRVEQWKKDLNMAREKAKARINKNLPKTKFKEGDFVIIKDFSILPGVNKTLYSKYKNEIFKVNKVKNHSLVVLSLTNHTLRLVSTNNLKRIKHENVEQLDLSNDIKKELLQGTDNLKLKDFKTLTKQGASLILPDPSLEEIEDDLSDIEIDFDEEIIPKRVRFDLDPDIND